MFRKASSILEGLGLLIVVPALFVLAYIYFLFPKLQEVPLCGVRRFLGIRCPGCGLTTSMAALAHLQIRESIAAHPLGIVIALWLTYMFIRSVYFMLLKKDLPQLLSQRQRDFLIYVFLVALILQWVINLFIAAA